jgi:hypothetical protein
MYRGAVTQRGTNGRGKVNGSRTDPITPRDTVEESFLVFHLLRKNSTRIGMADCLQTESEKYYSEFMDIQKEIPSGLGSLLNKLLSASSWSWISSLGQNIQRVQQLLKGDSPTGLYEVLDYNAMLDLVDPQGEIAFFKKWQKVRFLQDHVVAFQDHSWGDGNVLADYRCSPGRLVDRYLDGNRWNLLISLRETKSAGDIENLYMQTKLRHSFTKNDEWWQVEMYSETQWLKLSILFPRGRHCQRAVLFEKTKNQTIPLDPKQFANLPDGRQLLKWETQKPRRFETYTLKWTW